MADRARLLARARATQGGTSLIEIMVVLVVLLLGIVLALRIFPTGFGIMRANGNRSQATRLAEQQMSQLRADATNLPQGVLFTYPDANGQLQTVTRVDPDLLQTYNPTTEGNEDPADDIEVDYNPYFSDLNRFRFIKGEAVKVPLPTATGFGTGGAYTCKFGPILMAQDAGDPNRAPGNATERALFNSYLAVYGAPLTGTNIESGGAGTQAPAGFLRTQQNYVIDYGDDDGEPALIAFAPRSPNAGRTNTVRTFRITITHDNGGVLTTSTVDLPVDDSQAGVWLAIPGVSDAIPGSETVSREFDRIAFTTPWDSTDPYQYKLRSPNIALGGQATTFANIGMINFNPAGGTYSEDTATGTRPFVAYLDYAVLDWHILRDDREVPTVFTGPGGTIPLRLTIPSIKSVGDSELDGTFYSGLYGDPTQPVAIQVFNLNDPAATTPLIQGAYRDVTGAVNPQPIAPNTVADYYIDEDERGGSYRTGTIYINSNRVPAGSKLRILYKAVGDWGVSFQKAYNRYETAVDPTNPALRSPLPLRGRPDAYGIAGQGQTAQLRFPLSDLNKSFVVTVGYTLSDGTVKRLQPIQMTADAVGQETGVDITRYDDKFAVVDVYKFLPSGAQAEFVNAASWGVNGSLSGVSVKTRVIWRDTDSGKARWRVQDMDSFLTPQAE
jgi:type II secretory pathway pseudopilin PulG